MGTKYNMSATKEFKSHSSWLYNERIAILDYLIDVDSVSLNMDPTNVNLIKKIYSLNKQKYKNVRMVIRSDPSLRAQLGLRTKLEGVYVTDVQIGIIDRMIRWCEVHNSYTFKNCYIIVAELNNFEIAIKDILQHYSYYIRTSVKQKPDILVATQKYKQLADSSTIQQLKEIAGKNHKIDFENMSIGTDIKDDDDLDDEQDEFSDSELDTDDDDDVIMDIEDDDEE